METVVPESKSRNLQQFLTHSKWEHREVIDHVAQDADALLGDERDACFLIDESGFAKQRKRSVGVSRQWLGRLGKVDNGQVAVYGALANGQYVAPVDVRLYLPEEWVNDPIRCECAGVPEEERRFRTINELALEMVRHARKTGLRYGWVGAFVSAGTFAATAGVISTTMAAALVGGELTATSAIVVSGAVLGALTSGAAATLLAKVFSNENANVSKMGCYAGPPWPWNKKVHTYKVTGGPTYNPRPDGKIELIGAPLRLK
jgi:hypothetical protein